MAKYEEEPGVYSTKKPRPEEDRGTHKVRLNAESIDEDDVESAAGD